MKIHEYQAKQILSRYGIPVPKSEVAFSVEEAKKGAEALGEGVRVVKAQIHAGGRGKGGGVKVTTSTEPSVGVVDTVFAVVFLVNTPVCVTLFLNLILRIVSTEPPS